LKEVRSTGGAERKEVIAQKRAVREILPLTELVQKEGKMERNLRINVIVVSVFIAFGIFGTFGIGQTAGKPEKLVFGVIADMTGPYAPVTGPANAAMADVAEYVNETGGIKGVPLEVVVRDCASKVDIGMNMYMQMREMKPRPSMIYSLISGVTEALKARSNEDQLVLLGTSNPEVVFPTTYVFGSFVTYADECGLWLQWLVESWKEKRPPRLAFLTWDSTLGKGVLYDEVYNYAKSKGIEVVGVELFGVRDLDVTNQLMKIRAKQADWIFTNSLSNGPVVIAKTAKQMGYKVGLVGAALDDSTLFIDRNAMEGAMAIHTFCNWSETNNKGIQLMNKYFEKNKRPPTYRTYMYPMGFTSVLLFREVVSRIVDKYGWDMLNGPTLRKELEAMKEFNAEDIGIFSYSPDRHAPEKAKVLQIKGGKMVPVTGLRICPDLRQEKYR
jgi:branched-chain amino acid transport system substrate-binding protein